MDTSAPTTAPEFVLPDQDGRPVRLGDTLGRGPVVLTFFRGHWCPYCRRYLGKLQEHMPRLQAAGATVLAISPEPPATARALATDLSLTFPLLGDVDGVIIDRYGTRNGFLRARSLIPHPAVFILDPSGTIRFRSIDRNYKKRTTMRTILGVIDELRAGD